MRVARPGCGLKLRESERPGIAAFIFIGELVFAEVDSEPLLMALDMAGIAVSAGSACTSGALEPSHVIAALRAGERWQRGVIRFSLGAGTTSAQIERVVAALPGIIAQLRSAASLA